MQMDRQMPAVVLKVAISGEEMQISAGGDTAEKHIDRGCSDAV